MAKLEYNLGLPDEPKFVAREALDRRWIGLRVGHFGPELLNLLRNLGDLSVNPVSLTLQVSQPRKPSGRKDEDWNRYR